MTEAEQNAVIAERVMGLKHVKVLRCWRDPECGTWVVAGDTEADSMLADANGDLKTCYLPDGREEFVDDPTYYEVAPDYFRDPAAALELLYAVQRLWFENESKRDAFEYRLAEEQFRRTGYTFQRLWKFHHADIAPAVWRVLEGEKDAD